MCHLAFVSYVERKKSYHLRNTQLCFKSNTYLPSEQKKCLKTQNNFISPRGQLKRKKIVRFDAFMIKFFCLYPQPLN
jgi:hypothetical protein